ncbi:hypothetical protein JHK82_057161 [Glycine max]|nr:hypothetical protein JHK84_057048 [Glycine max]KAG5078466.1 hypothetical protein JHK82_057161 [Glycine max]KAH1037414.1 hypothetical protein GYH30_056684 [Glycine max]
MNTSSNPLQEAQATSSAETLINIPRVAVEASGASSYGAVSSNISGEIIGNNSHSEISEEMEFWHNMFMITHHKGMKIVVVAGEGRRWGMESIATSETVTCNTGREEEVLGLRGIFNCLRVWGCRK